MPNVDAMQRVVCKIELSNSIFRYASRNSALELGACVTYFLPITRSLYGVWILPVSMKCGTRVVGEKLTRTSVCTLYVVTILVEENRTKTSAGWSRLFSPVKVTPKRVRHFSECRWKLSCPFLTVLFPRVKRGIKSRRATYTLTYTKRMCYSCKKGGKKLDKVRV